MDTKNNNKICYDCCQSINIHATKKIAANIRNHSSILYIFLTWEIIVCCVYIRCRGAHSHT